MSMSMLKKALKRMKVAGKKASKKKSRVPLSKDPLARQERGSVRQGLNVAQRKARSRFYKKVDEKYNRDPMDYGGDLGAEVRYK